LTAEIHCLIDEKKDFASMAKAWSSSPAFTNAVSNRFVSRPAGDPTRAILPTRTGPRLRSTIVTAADLPRPWAVSISQSPKQER